MLVQTKLTDKKKKTRRHSVRRAKNRNGKKLGPSSNGGGSKGSITGGHIPPYGKRKAKKANPSKINLPSFTPWKVILTSFLIGICGILYITHVFNTQQALEELQMLEREYNKINRLHAEKRLEYDRLIGPKEVYQRARQQGFVNAGPADRVIILK